MALSVVTQREDFDFDYVRVGDCFIDMAYGREVDDRALEKFDTWDDKMVGAISLSLRNDGRYAILDGGHRLTKYRMLHGDDAQMRALIYIDLTLEAEASIWSGLNRNRKKTTPAEEFHADLAAKYPDALEIQSILDSLGLHFHGRGLPKEAAIEGVETVRRIYRNYGTNSLREILLTLRDSMGSGEGAIQAGVITGLAAFSTRYYGLPMFEKTRLEEVLSTHSPAQIKSLAATIRSASGKADMASCIGMAILQMYNHGLRRKQLPPWQATAIAKAA